ncbi:aminomethyl transferase family protein [Microbacterium sp. zg.B48]|uniref:aminomethyl transferase family protein n=1 Tax=unclassified Microbacterium TaxID=2609290 RepID=UPI00214BF890|nr:MULTISPECIES: aminomethyl transferase family protein [unclassified Microbacterium]MCR2764011.1 aminomethyl transferase family protein [Microbacterium sp. zg.B48]MCR2810432.1 aminomethyl transferase family protein [Microbacterium sp. zg.B185]WIM18485.1 aminomethyl transferase family protein [Microbacterium sp. zg-B185]
MFYKGEPPVKTLFHRRRGAETFHGGIVMPENLEEAIAEAGGPVPLLWESEAPPAVVPRVVQEFRNWRDEQLAWRRTAVLFDQSHHMADLNIKGPDALKLIRDTAVNSVENFPVDMAKQYVAVSPSGHVIGDNILFHLEEDEYQAVGIPPSINWLHYHAVTGGYDVEIWRDDNSLYRSGDPVLYRYQVQGPGALEIIREATGQEPPKLRFFRMTRFTIGGKEVRALRHGMAGEPGYELWGPWADSEAVHTALLEAGAKHDMVQVGGRAYHTNALESGWLPRPLPAIYSDERLADYRRWLSGTAYETTAPLGGSFHSEDIEDYYFTPYDLDYGRIVAFDHDFIGREALERMASDGTADKRRKVTLVWNGDDSAAAYGSMFHPGPGAKFINLPMSLYDTFHADRVETADGRMVGISTWTGYSANERAILSLAVVDADVAEPGTELVVVWGEDRPTRKVQVEEHVQVRIRVTVQPAPLTEFARTAYRSDTVSA